MNKIHVIDNVISKEAQEEIKNLLYSNNTAHTSEVTYMPDFRNHLHIYLI